MSPWSPGASHLQLPSSPQPDLKFRSPGAHRFAYSCGDGESQATACDLHSHMFTFGSARGKRRQGALTVMTLIIYHKAGTTGSLCGTDGGSGTGAQPAPHLHSAVRACVRVCLRGEGR